jgi:peptide/nickel transport system substrate-binding protein
MKNATRPHFRLALAPLAGLLLTACSGGGSFDDSADSAGGGTGAAGESSRLVIAQSSDILTMDPHMHRNRPTQNVVHQVFESLVGQDAELNAVPELATEWEQVDDTTWRFHLREDVTFHNGEAFDADDVKFSIERILDPEQASPRASMLAVIDTVEVEDEHTVVITTTAPAPTLLPSLAVNEIVPSEYVNEVGDEQFAAEPVGTGPFIFESWSPNEAVNLTANPDYWGGKPTIDSLVFRPIPEVSSRMAALQSGDVHIAAEIPPDLAGELGGGTQAVGVPGTRVFFLAMNVTQPPFDQHEVRVAANQAVDKETLVSALYEGRARVLNQPAFPEMIGYTDDLQGYEFDLEAASAVLQSVSETVEIDSTEATRTLAEAVAGQLQAAGLTAEVSVLEEQAFLDRIESGASTAYVSSWGVAEGDSDVIFARHFWSPSREGAFYTGYTNPQLDELIVRGRSTLDEAEREQIYAEAMQIVMDDAPWVPLLNPEEIYGVSEAVQGWEPSPIGRFNVADVTLAG